jgi:hypothetical protein
VVGGFVHGERADLAAAVECLDEVEELADLVGEEDAELGDGRG